jgi:hypothetical protein
MTTPRDYLIVVIDDLRTPAMGTDEPGGGNIVVELHRSLSAGLAAIQGYKDSGTRIDELWLDHDLGFNPEGDEPDFTTIMPLVEWMEEQAFNGEVMDIGHVYVHTANPAAAPRMVAALNKYYAVSIDELLLADVQEYPDYL